MTTTATTDRSLASQLRFSVMRLRRRLSNERQTIDGQSADDLSVGARSVLGVLFRGGEQSVGQLAEIERVKPPSMTRTVNCLVEEGYAERRQADTDKRQVLVRLSDQGRERVLADRRRRDAWLDQRLAELSADDRAALRKAAPILERLANAD